MLCLVCFITIKPGISNMFLGAGFYKVNITPPPASAHIHLIVHLNGILPANLNNQVVNYSIVEDENVSSNFIWNYMTGHFFAVFIYLFQILMWPNTLNSAWIYLVCFTKYIFTLQGNFHCNTCLWHAVKQAYQAMESKDHPLQRTLNGKSGTWSD